MNAMRGYADTVMHSLKGIGIALFGCAIGLGIVFVFAAFLWSLFHLAGLI